ncbi:hypothetical protein Taro_017555 [Colocasia esculenta]|uniref:Uncharacterized protein n=1 Tax=Colocasia esculenta TaxID=4460 RepID=A0A843UTK5_COLES|nr:hypothetical protein [Colocasia esculenta]
MQTQAHTQAVLQAQLEAQKAQAPAPVPQEHGHGGPSIMEWFKRMAPPSFKGESDLLLAESWMTEIEKIFPALCAPRRTMSAWPPICYSQQVVAPRSPDVRPSGKKECPHCGRTHGGTKCWKLSRKCLKCGSREHQIRDYPRLQQGFQRGAPALAAAAAAAPATGRPRRPRAQARVFALAREDAEQAEHVIEGIDEGLLSSRRVEGKKKVQPIFSHTIENASGTGLTTSETHPCRATRPRRVTPSQRQ